jgi:hypothetical protein
MLEYLPTDSPCTSAQEHPAVRAWHALGPRGIAPAAIETLKHTRKSAVFRLWGAGPDGSAVIAKRCRRATGAVERTLYEEVLPRLPVPTLRFYGGRDDSDAECCWLFLEDAGGEEYSPENETYCTAASQWLARVHTAPLDAGLVERLPDQGPACYREHLRLARARIVKNISNPSLRAEDVAELETILSESDAITTSWSRLEACCDGMPRGLVHGDFVPKNLGVRAGSAGPVLLPFDWEVAGWGVPAADLAECPDLRAYGALVGPYWPHVTFEELRRLAGCGRVFRLVAAISWASWGLAYPAVEKAMKNLRCYAADLAELVPALESGRLGL